MIRTRYRADAATRVSTGAISHARRVRPVWYRARALALAWSARMQVIFPQSDRCRWTGLAVLRSGVSYASARRQWRL